MSKYEQLLKFIPVFENNANTLYSYRKPAQSEDGVLSIGGVVEYSESFLAFINEFYRSDLVNADYVSVIDSCAKNMDDSELIATADRELLTALFTKNIRAERFCEGFYVRAIEDQVFLALLKRLKAVENE